MGLPIRVLLFTCLAVPSALAHSADEGTVYVDTALRAKPSFRAPPVARVSANTRVVVAARRGIWLRVSVGGPQGRAGWLRRFDVRLASKSSRYTKRRSSSGGGLFGSGVKRGHSVTATIGVRGLDAADLEAAHPAPAELRRLDRLISRPAEAERLAREGGLQRHEVAYLGEAMGSAGGGMPLDEASPDAGWGDEETETPELGGDSDW